MYKKALGSKRIERACARLKEKFCSGCMEQDPDLKKVYAEEDSFRTDDHVVILEKMIEKQQQKICEQQTEIENLRKKLNI